MLTVVTDGPTAMLPCAGHPIFQKLEQTKKLSVYNQLLRDGLLIVE